MFSIRRKRRLWNASSLQPMPFLNFHNSHPYITVEEAEFGFYADPLGFADVLEEGKCFSIFGEPCFDRWPKCSIGSHLGA